MTTKSQGSAEQRGRRVLEVVDGQGIYGARIAAGGRWFFFSGNALDTNGTLAPEAVPPALYTSSDAANVRFQTRYVYERYRDCLPALGATLNDVVSMEQYVNKKVHADGFLETSRSPGYLDPPRPVSALVEVGRYIPSACVINQNGIGYASEGGGSAKEIHRTDMLFAAAKKDRPGVGLSDSEGAKAPPYSEVVSAGPYTFCTVFASDFRSGPHPDMRVAEWSWWGSEMRSEALWAGAALEKMLAVAGSDVSSVVHCTVFVQEVGDLYELDLVWAKLFPKNPPARTVIPVQGFGQPRREGAKHHWEGSPKMEMQFRALRPGHDVTRNVVAVPGGANPVESDGILAGDLLWISGQMANPEDAKRDTESELVAIFDRIDRICKEAGVGIRNLLRARAYVTSEEAGYAFYKELKKRIPADPPTVSVSIVPAPLPFVSATCLVDAVAYVPPRN